LAAGDLRATYASGTMRRVVVISSACGLLAINALAVVLLVGPLSANSSDATVVPSDSSSADADTQLAVAPAGTRPPGVQDMDAALASVGATPELGNWPSWCGAPPEGPWKRFGVTVDGTHVAVVIASAGDGTRLWQQQLKELTGCSQFRVVQSTSDSLTLRRSDVPVAWTVARYGDVFVSVLQVNEAASTDAVSMLASQVLDRTAAQCVADPQESMDRNPWRPGYVPWHPAVPIDTPDPTGPKVPEIIATVDWPAPVATPRPDLGVLAKPDVSFNPYTTDVMVAPISKVPVLIDPATIIPPAVDRPPSAPPATVPAPEAAIAYFAREDTVGPGCGWAFAGTVPPVFDPTLPGKELESRIDGAFATEAANLASWLVYSLDARTYAPEDAATRAALEAWGKYDEAFRKATTAWDAALARRQASLDMWFAYVPEDPLTLPTAPAPSASPTDSTSPAPSGSPSAPPAPAGAVR